MTNKKCITRQHIQKTTETKISGYEIQIESFNGEFKQKFNVNSPDIKIVTNALDMLVDDIEFEIGNIKITPKTMDITYLLGKGTKK